MERKRRKKNSSSRGRFRSFDLWVMGPARSRCATLLMAEWVKFVYLPYVYSSQSFLMSSTQGIAAFGWPRASFSWWMLVLMPRNIGERKGFSSLRARIRALFVMIEQFLSKRKFNVLATILSLLGWIKAIRFLSRSCLYLSSSCWGFWDSKDSSTASSESAISKAEAPSFPLVMASLSLWGWSVKSERGISCDP